MIEAMKQALEALEQWNAPSYKRHNAITSLRQAIAEAENYEVIQEPVAFPPVQFTKVTDGIEIGYDFLGGVDIRLGGEFVYVHINYDYRYTHNAARKALAKQIVGLLTHPPTEERNFCPHCGKRTNDIHTCTPPQPQQRPLTNEQIGAIWRGIDGSEGILMRFARAIEAAHDIKGEA